MDKFYTVFLFCAELSSAYSIKPEIDWGYTSGTISRRDEDFPFPGCFNSYQAKAMYLRSTSQFLRSQKNWRLSNFEYLCSYQSQIHKIISLKIYFVKAELARPFTYYVCRN